MFDESAFLTRDELIKERTTEEFCEWTEMKLCEWASLKGSDPNDRERHKRVIMRKGLFGPFHEEVLPFCRYLQAGKQVSVSNRCAIHLDSALHYDATLTVGGRMILFEITQAIEDRHDVRMEQFLEKGQVNVLGRMKISGTKRNGRKVVVEDEFIASGQARADLKELVIRRLQRKPDGATNNQNYDPDTKLLITINDYALNTEEHPLLDNDLSASSIVRQNTFRSITIIGIAGRLILEYQRK